MKNIKSELEYKKIMSEILKLMNKGEDNLSKKRQPDVTFLKVAHKKLGIDAAFLLTHV